MKTIMFGLFKKDPVKKLQKKYKDLMEESYRLSTSDRKASDLKRAEAEAVIKEIEAIQKKS
ncbi:MAG: Lacal_2735 family protein [Saprospiraceae bacterium]